MLKLTSDTMIILDKNGICIDIAIYNVDLWFMKEDKLLGKNLLSLIPPSTYAQIYPEFHKVLTHKTRSVRNYEMTLGNTTYFSNASCIRSTEWYSANTGTSRNVACASWNLKEKPGTE